MLGIDVTVDLSKIKAAYAQKAKSVHPEEYPEEFQELQKAYKSAMKYAKMHNAYKNAIQNNEALYHIDDSENISEEETTLKKGIVFDKKVSDKEIIVDLENRTKEKQKVDKEIALNTEKVTIEDEPEFIYDEISYEEKSQQCMLDMICLAKNIYLINDRRCWEWFFSRDEYKELYKNDEFRLNFVETIKRIFGWTRKTLLYIEAFLKMYQKDSSKRTETSTIKWKIFKRPKLFDHMKSKQTNVTNEQKRIHDIILAGVKNKGYSGNMNDLNTFLEYVNVYLEYARNNMGRVEDLYQSGKHSTHVLTYIYIFVVLIVIIILYGFFSGNTHQKTEQEKRLEKWEQERRENIEKFNQERLEQLLKERRERLNKLEEEKEKINDEIEEEREKISEEVDNIIK